MVIKTKIDPEVYLILRHSFISREQVKTSLIRYDAVLLISEQIMQRYEQYLEKCAETWEATKRTSVSYILQTEQSIKHLSSKIINIFYQKFYQYICLLTFS